MSIQLSVGQFLAEVNSVIELILDHEYVPLVGCTAAVAAIAALAVSWRGERKTKAWERQWNEADVATRALLLESNPTQPGFAGLIERLFFSRELKELASQWLVDVECERLGVSPDQLDRALLVEQARARGVGVFPGMSDDQIRLELNRRDLWDGSVLVSRKRPAGRRVAGSAG